MYVARLVLLPCHLGPIVAFAHALITLHVVPSSGIRLLTQRLTRQEVYYVSELPGQLSLL